MLQTVAVRKYPSTSELLISSAGLGWSAISVELRSHGVSQAQTAFPQHVEICLVVNGNNGGLVRRTTGDVYQEAAPRTGAIWLSPAGIGKEISITAPIPQTMHLYLPAALLDRLKDDFNLRGLPAYSVHCAAGVVDDVIDQVGRSILREIANETSVGRMYVETASLTLAARLIQKYCELESKNSLTLFSRSLDDVRLRRVMDYISANLSEEITLEKLAEVAGYSAFHFARKFTLAMGISPGRYVSHKRLENAMAELAAGKLPLVEVALNAQFSSQASFTRAFHRATGMTPREYQRRRL